MVIFGGLGIYQFICEKLDHCTESQSKVGIKDNSKVIFLICQ